MKDLKLYLYWLYLFILCAALGFIPAPRSPLVAALLTLLTIAFFVPPAMLLYRDIHHRQRKHLKNILIISTCSLALTLVLFIANTLSVLAADNLLLGNILNALLVVFTAPMMCAPYQFLGMFGWACLLFTALSFWKKTGKSSPNSSKH